MRLSVRRTLGLALALCLLVGLFPAGAVAATKVTSLQLNRRLDVSASSAYLLVNNKYRVTFTAEPSKVTAGDFRFVSSDKSVAAVSASGMITTRRAGSATITVSARSGSVSDSIRICVLNSPNEIPTAPPAPAVTPVPVVALTPVIPPNPVLTYPVSHPLPTQQVQQIPAGQGSEYGHSVLAAGETLQSIAARYGVDVQRVIAANPALAGVTLTPGMVVFVPRPATQTPVPTLAATPSAPPIATEQPAPVATMTPVPVQPAPSDWVAPTPVPTPPMVVCPTVPPLVIVTQTPVPGTQLPAKDGYYSHQVTRQNETFVGIALRYGVTPQQLIDANPDLNPMNLPLGTVVYVFNQGAVAVDPNAPWPFEGLDAAISEFGLAMMAGQGENVCVSPLSMQVVLAMVAEGAVTPDAQALPTETMEQMLRAGGWMGDLNQLRAALGKLAAAVEGEREKTHVRIANGVFVDDDYTAALNPTFRQALEQSYAAGLIEMPFQNSVDAAGQINGWISERTQGLIPCAVDAGALQDAKMALVNTLYFKSDFYSAFPTEQTTKDSFRLSSGAAKTVDMMHRRGKYHRYEDAAIQAIKIPYQDGFSLIVALPKEDAVLAPPAMTAAQLTALQNSWQEFRYTDLALPKFSIETNVERLKELLAARGMTRAFDPQTAQFQGMLTPNAAVPSLYISSVLQKTKITTTETGTEAAAATAAIMMPTSAIIEPPTPFTVDRPFFFAVMHDESNVPLFMGNIGNP